MPSRKSPQGVTWKQGLGAAVILLTTGILYALFHPTYTVPLEVRYRASCQSNMKQLGLAYTQYAQDNDDAFPRGYTLGGEGWAGQVYPYVKAANVYHCPAETQSDPYVSYAENRNLAHQTVKALADPAVTVLLYEDTTPDCDPSSVRPWEMTSGTGLSAPQTSKRHDSTTFGLDFLFVDGHVKWLRPGAVSSGPGALSPKHLGSYAATFAIKKGRTGLGLRGQ